MVKQRITRCVTPYDFVAYDFFAVALDTDTMIGWSATEIGWPALLTDFTHQGGSIEGNRGISFPDLL